MKKIAVAAALSLAMTAPAFAADAGMEIGAFPKNAAEAEYCAKAWADPDIEVPNGCKPLWLRVLNRVSEAASS